MAHHDGNIVEMDERLKGRKHLEILLHEATHLIFPSASEEETERISIAFTKLLWKEKYRRIEDNEDTPLQDGSI